MFARLLTLTKLYQLAAQQVALSRRTVIKLTAGEWTELNEDEQFRTIYAGRDHVEMNGVIITVQAPNARTAAPSSE
jgi:hypothetical protein